jgi:hypothetical protein
MTLKLRFLLLAVMALILIPGISTAVSLEQGQESRQVGNIPPEEPLTGPCCPMSMSLPCVNSAKIGKPIPVGELWIYPLTGRPCDQRHYTTMDEALRRGELVILEQAMATVNTLMAQNRSSNHVFLMGGEVLLGGKQNRMIVNDTLLPPNSGWIPIQVYCGERHRWNHSKDGFSGKGLLAPAQLRNQVYSGTTQDQVWSGINRRIEENSVSTPTENMEQLYLQGKQAKIVQGCEKRFNRRFPKNTFGMVIYKGNRAVGVELFANYHLFNKLHQKVLRSYIFDFLPGGCGPKVPTPYAPSNMEVRTWLSGLVNADYRNRPTPGAGCLNDFSYSGQSGQALLLDCGLVHLGGIATMPVPPVRIYK